MKLLTIPLMPCGSIVKSPRSTATAETMTLATIMITNILGSDDRDMEVTRLDLLSRNLMMK